MKKVLAVLATGTALLLGGCASPDVAATVGDATITVDEVETMTGVECALSESAGQEGSAQPVRLRRAASLSRLIDVEVFKVAAEETGGAYDRETYATELAGLRQQLEPLPEAQRAAAEELFADYLKRILQLREVAERGLAEQGVTEPDQAQLEQALQAEYAEARAGLDIEVNPAYGPDEAGVPGGVDGSMSVAVSEYAKQAGTAQPGADYVAGLSPRMLCG